jgi:hypothetical protein
MKCRSCGRAARKTVIAFVLTPDGLKGGRVCGECAKDGWLLVAPKLAPVVKHKVVRWEGVENALRTLRRYAAAARTTSDVSFFDGRKSGFESAIEVLKRECGES